MRRSLALAAVCLLTATSALAFVAPENQGALGALAKTNPASSLERQLAPYAELSSALPAAWRSFAPALGPQAEIYFDLATGEAALVQGAPVPFIPGTGNSLTLDDLATRLGHPVGKVDEAVVTELADRFLDEHAALLTVPRQEIVVRKVVQATPHLWVATYIHAPSGIEVVGSRLTLVIGHGNLLMWGSEGIFPRAAGTPSAIVLGKGQAEAALATYAGWNAATDAWIAPPALHYFPEQAGPAALGGDLPGKHHRLAWELSFQRAGTVGSWLGHVDAVTGAVIDFADANQYGVVRGGVEPTTWTDTEENRPLGGVAMSSCGAGPSCFTSIEGLFDSPAGSTTGSLSGRLTNISDRCGAAGAPTVDAGGTGDVEFGLGPPNPSGDADCTTNGVGNSGGLHNTHAARSAFYHITRLKDDAHSWLPANGWLDSAHQVRVNIDNVCNAYWSSGGWNGFFREGFSGGGTHCFNTGEIAGVFMHEVGHGMDQNDAQGTGSGSGEGYADSITQLRLHDSCVGRDFRLTNCGGYGVPCTACTSVRDQDYAKHTDGGNPVTTPFTPANFINVHCSSSPGGNCGREVHCESYVTGGTIWDLATRKLTSQYDQDTAWFQTERDFIVGTNFFTAAYACSGGGTSSNGCAATSWFKGMLAADDDNGDLTDGTPHAAHLFAAFNDHVIACGSSGDASNQNSAPTCPVLLPTVLAVTAGSGSIDLLWTPVVNAGGYTVLKNHGDCSSGYQQAANVTGTSYSDTDVSPGQLYGYRVVALRDATTPAANACYSDFSNCATATAIGGSIFSDGFESGDTSAWSATVP